MALLTKKLPAFTGTAPGQTASCRIPAGFTYHSIVFTATDPGGSDIFDWNKISEVRLIANGTIIQRYSGGELRVMNQYDRASGGYGKTIPLVVACDRTRLRTRANVESTGIPFGALNDPRPIYTMLLEVDLASNAPADTVLEGYSIVSPPVDLNNTPAVLKQVRKFIYSPTGAGDFEIADLPRAGLISRMFFSNPDKIDNIVVSMDSTEVWNRTRELNKFIIDGGHFKDLSSAGTYIFPIDTTENGYGNDVWDLSGVSDFRLRLKMNGAATLKLSVEYLAPLPV